MITLNQNMIRQTVTLKKHPNSFQYVCPMKNFPAILLIILFFSACDHTAKQLKEKIAGADSVAINYFKGDGTMDTVVAVKIIKDKKAIEQLTGLIAGSSTAVKDNCGYDGSIHFFKNDAVVQDIFFSSNKEACRQFVFILNGKKEATGLAAEAKEVLAGIKTK